MFLDLSKMTAKTHNNKVIGISAIGGIPVKSASNQSFTWLGNTANKKMLYNLVKDTLGHSALLTYNNSSNLSVEELGEICFNEGHWWAHHWFTISFAIAGYPKSVQEAFTRDSNILTSWSEDNSCNIFVAHATLKGWRNFLYHKDSKDFKFDVKEALQSIHTILEDII